MLFVIKDKHIKYLCAIILFQNIYLYKRMLKLHARVMDMFDTFDENRHQCAMDDLYNLAAFFVAA